MSFKLWICKKLYKVALKIVEVVVKNHNEKYTMLDEYLEKSEYLSYKGLDQQTYLIYGADNQWDKVCMNYKVIQEAIDRLYKFEHELYLERMKNRHLDYRRKQTYCGINNNLCKSPNEDNCRSCEEYKKLEETSN